MLLYMYIYNCLLDSDRTAINLDLREPWFLAGHA